MARLRITSSAAYIVESVESCWKCGSGTPVICVFCDGGEIEGDDWGRFSVSNLTAFNEPVRKALQLFPYFRLAKSKSADASYYANHCSRCGSLQGDFYLHSEPGGAFFPETRQDYAHIKFNLIDGDAELDGAEGAGPLEQAFEMWKGEA